MVALTSCKVSVVGDDAGAVGRSLPAASSLCTRGEPLGATAEAGKPSKAGFRWVSEEPSSQSQALAGLEHRVVMTKQQEEKQQQNS